MEISREQGVRKQNKGNRGLGTEHPGRSGSNFSHHAAIGDAELPEILAGMCWQGMPPYRHYIQKVNIVIKCSEIKIILVISSHKKMVYFSFYLNLKIIGFFCHTLYNRHRCDCNRTRTWITMNHNFLLKKKSKTKFHKNLTSGWVAETKPKPDGHTSPHKALVCFARNAQEAELLQDCTKIKG